jgi:hypothetical protein
MTCWQRMALFDGPDIKCPVGVMSRARRFRGAMEEYQSFADMCGLLQGGHHKHAEREALPGQGKDRGALHRAQW